MRKVSTSLTCVILSLLVLVRASGLPTQASPARDAQDAASVGTSLPIAPGATDAEGRTRLAQQAAAAEWEMGVRAYPNGVPAGARVAAWTKAQAMAASEPDQGPFGPQWWPIGPAPSTGGQTYAQTYDSQTNCRVDVTGRASVIAVNPANPDDVWLGAANGGVWHSPNGGQGWAPTSDYEASLAIGAIALDDCSAEGCSTIYAGTGENSMRRDTYYGAGLLVGEVDFENFVTVDWTLRGQDLFSLGAVNDVVPDPTTSGATKRLYVGLSSGVTASATESTVTAPEPPQGYGIYKSEDNGVTWDKLTVPGSDGARPTDLKQHPTDSNTLYAGFLGRGIFKGVRDPNTGLVTWCPLNPGINVPGCTPAAGLPDPIAAPFDHVEIAIYAADPDVMYAILGDCTNPILTSCNPSVYYSTDGGATWTEQTPGAPASYSRYTHVLTIHPSNPATVIYGGIGLWKSVDAGQIYTKLGGCTLHPDHHAVVFPDPANPNRMYDASDGGFAYSNNAGVTWTAGTGGLQITGFQSIAASSLTNTVIGGTQDNGTNMWLGTSIWEHRDDGDAGETIMSRQHQVLMYDTYYYEVPRRSLYGGGCCSWKWIDNGLAWPTAFYPAFVEDSQVTPGAPDPSIYPSYYKLYFGGDRLYASRLPPGETTTTWRPGDSWTPVSCPLGGTEAFFPDIRTANVITAIAVAPDDPDRIYIGYYDGQIFVTDGACVDADCANPTCWRPVGGPAKNLPSAVVTRIAVDPTDADTAYVTFSGFNLPGCAHVYKTVNGGLSWTPASGPSPCDPNDLDSLPDIPANTITLEPSNPARLWLGTDVGVFRSFDGGTTWDAWNGTSNWRLPNVAVYEIAIDPTRNRVIAGTHGRGAFLHSLTPDLHIDIDETACKPPCFLDIFMLANAVINPADTCEIQLIQADGTVFAESRLDAQGALIGADTRGQLVTTKAGFFSQRPGAWACFGGTCAGGVDITEFSDTENPITQAAVACGDQQGTTLIQGDKGVSGPPSNALSVAVASMRQPGGALPAGVRAGSFDLAVVLQAGDGSNHQLCTVNVPVEADAEPNDILMQASDLINRSPRCAAHSLQAEVVGLRPPEGAPEGEEDPPGTSVRLVLAAPGVTGVQLIMEIDAAPGDAAGMTFDVDNLGVPVNNALVPMQLQLETGRGGAAGGELTVVERSMLGTCAITVRTEPGAAADTLAATLAAAFQARGEPGADDSCPAMENPRDMVNVENSVQTTLASELVVYTNDTGIGYSLAPVALAPGSANLEIVKTDNVDPVSPGSQLTYALAVTNRGPAPATNVRVSDTLPAGVRFVEAVGDGWSCDRDGSSVRCSRGTLHVGAAPVIRVTVVAPQEPTSLTNRAAVEADTADPERGNNAASEPTRVEAPQVELYLPLIARSGGGAAGP